MSSKQGRIPGMQPKEIVEIEEKAEEVKELETQRMEIGEREQKARGELLDLMNTHKLKRYDLSEDREVIVEQGERKVFVRRKKKAKAKPAAETETKTEDTEAKGAEVA